MSEQQPLDIKWILIGFAIQGGLNWLLANLLVEPLGLPLVEAVGLVGGSLLFAAIVAFCAFFGGGVLGAYFSPGDTIREPAIAAILAIAFNAIINLSQAGFAVDAGSMLGLLIAAAVAFGFALAGAKVGERLQGDTTDKMRERGDLRK